MMTDLLLYALGAGLALALITGPLGALVVWQRLVYFGDTLAHSALLGVALGLLLQINLNLSVLATCVALAILLTVLQRWRGTTIDSLLGIFAHSGLALGVVALSLLQDPRVDLNALLFGDLLALTQSDLALLVITVAAVSAAVAWHWKALVAMAAHAELAAIEGLPVQRLRLILMMLIAVTIAVAMKIVGILLVTALLIVPAATASRFGRSPEQVAVAAIGCGMAAVVGGLVSAWYLDLPAGASVVLFATLLFLATQALPGVRRAL